MLDAPAAPRRAAQTRLRRTDEGIDDQPDEKNIKGQQPTGTGTGTGIAAPSQASNATQRKTGTADVGVWMEDTVDRPNDPGG
eukprot:6144828-Heterocapsa_arctica.AAC.1